MVNTAQDIVNVDGTEETRFMDYGVYSLFLIVACGKYRRSPFLFSENAIDIYDKYLNDMWMWSIQ